MREKYLPIGTVVLLKGGKKRAMITGFCSIAQENQEKIYDYSGCVYPEGYLSSNQVCLFDHDQIEKIFFEGFVDESVIPITNVRTTIPITSSIIAALRIVVPISPLSLPISLSV